MGIAAYIRAHGPWQVTHLERSLEEAIPELVQTRRFDGVIARIENTAIADAVAQLGIPTVDLRNAVEPRGGVNFDTDSDACASIAVEHFYQRGFRKLAYCGYSGMNFSDDRRKAFLKHCDKKQVVPLVYEMGVTAAMSDGMSSGIIKRETAGETPEQELIDWLSSLPAPTGVFACNDVCGRQVLQATALAGRRAPDEIAVLGVDDDEVICELANPPLSSIEPDTHRMGFEGAAMLAHLMTGGATEKQLVLIPPRHVAVRQSTDLLAIEDPDVVTAVRFIRNNACKGIGVKEVANVVSMARVTLERRFRILLNRSLREEIERVRMEQVRMLLTQTNYSLLQIAASTGYRSDAHLITAFRRHEDCTPGAYRRQFEHSI
jgi:LacI family transcriptional regulator